MALLSSVLVSTIKSSPWVDLPFFSPSLYQRIRLSPFHIHFSSLLRLWPLTITTTYGIVFFHKKKEKNKMPSGSHKLQCSVLVFPIIYLFTVSRADTHHLFSQTQTLISPRFVAFFVFIFIFLFFYLGQLIVLSYKRTAHSIGI